MALLELRNINSYYGKSHVLHGVSLSVPEGELVTLIGRNGAGKTTTLKSIIGHVTPKSGQIEFKGDRIDGREPHEISKRGVAFIPEHRRIFPDLTVYENLKLGYIGHDIDRELDEMLAEVYSYFPRLEERSDQSGGTLSGGEQQMLAIARGLLSDPDLLLVDEPTEGLMPTLVEDLREILKQINEDGMTMLLVEQNSRLALDISSYGYIIDEGIIEAEGSSAELRADEEIKRRYLTV